MDADAQSEVSVLKRRLAELEGEVAGEKQVSRHILSKVSAQEDVLLELRREMIEHRRETIELRRETSRIADSLALLRAEFTGFQEKISGIVADAVREGLKTR